MLQMPPTQTMVGCSKWTNQNIDLISHFGHAPLPQCIEGSYDFLCVHNNLKLGVVQCTRRHELFRALSPSLSELKPWLAPNAW